LDLFEACKHCGPPLVANAGPPVGPTDDLLSLRFEPERSAPGQWVPGSRRRTTPGSRVVRGGDFVEMLDEDAGPLFRVDDDLFIGHDPGATEAPGAAPRFKDWAHHHDDSLAVGADQSGPAFVLHDEEHSLFAGVESIIDRDDEVPERYWSPEVAGLGRRALALLADQCLLLAVLGIFFLAALLALQRNGLAAGLSLAAPGLQASVLPFALLAVLLSLVYSCFFHGSTGRTPGKALFGIEVRTGDGGAITWSRAILRWLGAALGLACAGIGIVWALFEPRRRGWADLISGTVVARPQRDPPRQISRR
jgi:uncharacterized RDD family membrane protein YckC